MRARRLVRGLLAPVLLVALVGTLAVLQYRWLGQVSEAEREQLRESLDRRARDFADEFDRTITHLYQGLRPVSAFDPAAPEAFLGRYDQWLASTPTPALVKAMYFARATSAGVVLYRFEPDGRSFVRADWPSSLAVVRERVSGGIDDAARGGPAGARMFTFTSSPIVPEVPALVMALPVASAVVLPRLPAPGGEHDFMMALRSSHSHVIVELDAAYVKDTLVPSLLARHFSEPGSRGYRVSVVDTDSQPIVSRNLGPGHAVDPDRADVVAPFFMVRPDTVRSATLTWTVPVGPNPPARGQAAATGPTVAGQVSAITVTKPAPIEEVRAGAGGGPIALRVGALAPGHWRVLVQHQAGSLDAAVAAARRRNLWLSFGILAVLAASVGLIVVNARRSERLAAQQMDFVATVSHELRTPLAVIRSAAQNLSAGVVHEGTQARRYGELIEGEGRRLTEMVEQVLEYAGLEGNRRRTASGRPIDAGRLAAEAAASSASLFEAEGVELTTAIAPDLPPVVADEGALRRALHNLLTNALKYAADGRTVAVEARAGLARGVREVQLVVSDQGPGIGADDLAHIFEPFYRGRNATERQVHGNGLGLSLVKRVAEAHGGRVTARSAPGAGATFTIHLPAAPASEAAEPLEAAADAGGQIP